MVLIQDKSIARGSGKACLEKTVNESDSFLGLVVSDEADFGILKLDCMF